MKDFNKLIDICMDEVRHAGIVPGNIVEWKINTRARQRWGLCQTVNGKSTISISDRLLVDDRISEKACKETIIHEILHTCPECRGHGPKWKEYAGVMNSKYGYNIKRVTSGSEKGVEEYEARNILPSKYFFCCKYCNQMVVKKKKCKFVKYYRLYKCLNCNNTGGFQKL